MSIAAAVPVALAAAACYGVASALQAVEARAATAARPQESGIWALMHRPRWLVGVLADVLGLVLHVIALTLGPASLVQPLQVVGLLVALPLSRKLGQSAVTVDARRRTLRRLLRGEAVPALILVACLGLFLARTRPKVASVSLGLVGITGLLAAGAGAQLLAVLGTRRTTSARRPVLLAASAGTAFAITSVLIDSLARERRLSGWTVLMAPHGLVLIGGAIGLGVGSLAVSQRAFQSGPLARSLPTITVADPVIAVVLGGAFLGETPRLTVLDVVLDIVSLAGVALSVLALTRITAQATTTGSAIGGGVNSEPAKPTAARHRSGRRLASLAAVGSGYGLVIAVVAAAVDGRLDHDDGLRTRLSILLVGVLAASSANILINGSRTASHDTLTAQGSRADSLPP